MATREEMAEDRRQRLLDEEKRITEALEHLREAMKEEVDIDPDEGDPALIEREKDVAFANQLEAKLEGVQAALRAIAKGRYGICERCNKEIDPERLEVKPDATLCLTCQVEVEKLIRRGLMPTPPPEIL